MKEGDAEWWAQLQRRARLDRHVRVDAAIITGDANLLFPGTPLILPSEDGDESSKGPSQVSVQSDVVSPSGPPVEGQTGGSDGYPVMSLESYHHATADEEAPHPSSGRDAAAAAAVEGEAMSAHSPQARAAPPADLPRIDRRQLMDDECLEAVRAHLDHTLHSLEDRKQGYRYQVVALARRMLDQPQLEYFESEAAARARPFDTQVGDYEDSLRRGLTRNGALPAHSKLVGVHDDVMTDLAAVGLAQSAVQHD